MEPAVTSREATDDDQPWLSPESSETLVILGGGGTAAVLTLATVMAEKGYPFP